MSLKVIGSPTTRAFRVIWMMEELGEPYEIVPAKPQSETLRNYNPSGKAPVLIDDQLVLRDSTAILQYLADKFGRFTFPANTPERALQDSLTFFALDEIEGPCWNHIKHSFVLPEDRRCDTAKPTFKYEFERGQKALEARLGDGKFAMGDDLTIPDIIMGDVAGWAKFCGYDWRPGAVTAYFERLRSRPALRRATEIRKAG